MEEDEEEEEDEVSEGAAAAPPTRASGLSSLLQEAARMPGRSPAVTRVMTGPLFRMPQNVIVGLDAAVDGRNQAEAQEKEKPAPSRDPERLRMIQERSECLRNPGNQGQYLIQSHFIVILCTTGKNVL